MFKNISFMIIVFVYIGCGGGSDSPNEQETGEVLKTYTLKVVDDAVLESTVEAIGCKEVSELGNGAYNFKCTTPPQFISAKGGFVDLNKDGKHDANEVSMGLPLLVNLDANIFDINLSNIAITPLSTLVANVTDKEELKKLAIKLGISEKDFLKDISQENVELFQKLNTLLIIAEASGITDQLLLMKKLREKIVISSEIDIGDILNDALNALKNDPDLKKAYGDVFISGFINESQNYMDKEDVLKELAGDYADVDSSRIYITGFIYDALIANADIEILDGEIVVGEVKASAQGRWKISIKESILIEDKVLLFQGTAIDENGDKLLLKSAISTGKLRELSKRRISVADSIDLVISNVTTAQVAILEKNDKDFINKPNELEAEKNKIEIFQQELLLKAASAIKSIIDGDTRIGIEEDTYSFIFDNLLFKGGDNLELDLEGKISDEELTLQADKIKEDAILGQQLLTIESEKILTPILEKSLYMIEYLGNSLIKKYKKVVISNTKIVEKSYELESGTWKNTLSVEYVGKIINNVFYFDNESSNAPYAITLKEQKSVHSVELNKDYTFSILGKQLYLPYNNEELSEVGINIYVESFDVVTLWKELEDSKIISALGTEYAKGTIEEQNLALSRYIISKISEEPEPFDRSSTKLNSVIEIFENMDIEVDDVSANLANVKSILNSAESDDKDAQVGKALFALAEITNSDEVGNLIEFNLEGNVVSSNEHLTSILESSKSDALEIKLLDNIIDLSETSMELVHNTVLKLQEINTTLGINFADESYIFSYKDVNITNNQVKLLRVSILAAASKLEYLTAFNYVTFDDVKIRTTELNGTEAEYQNISANPLPIFKRSDVGSLNTTFGAERLLNAKELLLEALNVLAVVVASKEDDAELVTSIEEAQAEVNALRASLNGGALYRVEGDKHKDTDVTVTTYIDLSAFYTASTVLDLTHTFGHDFEYKNKHSYTYTDGKSYTAGDYSVELSQFYNDTRAKEWVSEDGSTLSYDYFGYYFPKLEMELKTIPIGTNSHISSVVKRIEVKKVGQESITHTGDNILQYMFDNLDYDWDSTASGSRTYRINKNSFFLNTTLEYGVNLLYGNVELVNLDSIKGEVTVKVQDGFTGQQYFEIEIYDNLGHYENIYGYLYGSTTGTEVD